MKESYREGLANHSGPEPCEGGSNAALEALNRGICTQFFLTGPNARQRGCHLPEGTSGRPPIRVALLSSR
jgi:hypothetical protein